MHRAESPTKRECAGGVWNQTDGAEARREDAGEGRKDGMDVVSLVAVWSGRGEDGGDEDASRRAVCACAGGGQV